MVREGQANFQTTNQDDYHQTDDNLVGIRGKKPGEVIVCRIIDRKDERISQKGIILSLKKT